jgi:glutamine synthetase
MRLSIASPGNDFRLGACEAPPSIMSLYLGEDLTTFLESYVNGEEPSYNPIKKTINLGSSTTTAIEIPAQDRNRTSPFPFSGHRFEFRSVGSSQNVSLVNTVLATITAKSFKNFSDQIENGVSPKEVAQESLKRSWNVIFNGDNYDLDNQQILSKKGLSHIDSTVEAIKCFTSPKNMNLFKEMNVLSNEECESRQQIMLNHYIGTIEMECLCMIDMIQQHIIPSCKNANIGSVELVKSVVILKDNLSNIRLENDIIVKAELSRKLRLEIMAEVRVVCDKIEEICPANLWTLSTYNELLFLDHHTV